MHDNTLVRGLINTGVDIQLIPTYTPIRTDEDNISIDHVFFGGINVYLQQRIPLFRHLPAFLDRFLDNPRLIKRATARSIDVDAKVLGGLTVSMLKGMNGNQKKEVKRLVRWLQHEVQPDLVVFTNMLIGGCIPYLKETLNVPTLVTLQGDDIFLKELTEPFQSDALKEIYKLVDQVDGFISHSQFYAEAMSDYLRIPREKIHITPLGIDTHDFSPVAEARHAAPASDIPTIGYLARLAPEKGLHVLVDAFIELQQRTDPPPARLWIAGWLGNHRQAYAEEQFEKLRQAGLGDRFKYFGEVDRHQKVDFLREIDILSVPTVYHEPKGLFALEAMACGVPCVLPSHGAFPELIHDTQAGKLFTPEDPVALADHLESLIRDPDLRRELGENGHRGVLGGAPGMTDN